MKFISTSTSDGLRLHGAISETEDKENIIIHIHGMAGDFYQNPYSPLMFEKYLIANIAFLAGENRGTHLATLFNTINGDSKIIGNSYEIFEDCVYDIQAWVDSAKNLGYENIWLQGHSLGTSKIAYYISTKPDRNIAGLILISPSDMIELVHDPEGQKDHDLLYPEAKFLMSENKPNQLLSNLLWGYDRLSAQTYLNFFSDDSKTAIFNYKRPDLGWEVVNNIHIPVLAITGTEDDGIQPIIEPAQAMEILKKELKNSPKVKTILYEGAKHSFNGFEENIIKDVIEFIVS